MGSSLSFKHVWLNNNILSIWFYQDPFKFSDKCLGFSLELVDEFTKIVQSAFGPFIGHHQGLFAYVKSVFLRSLLKSLLGFFITLQNYINTELDKTEMLMN